MGLLGLGGGGAVGGGLKGDGIHRGVIVDEADEVDFSSLAVSFSSFTSLLLMSKYLSNSPIETSERSLEVKDFLRS